MIEAQHAREIAQSALRELEAEWGTPLAVWDGQFGVEAVEDHGDVWLVNWNSVAYLESGDFAAQQLVGPILVPKDGGPWTVLGTAGTVEESVAHWRRAASGRGRAAGPGTRGKYGPHSDVVDAFLTEVRTATVQTWRTYAEHDRLSSEVVAAARAAQRAGFPASVLSAIHSATQRLGWELPVCDDDLPGGYATSRLSLRIRSAALALAAGEKLSPAHRRVLLSAFVAAGFTVR